MGKNIKLFNSHDLEELEDNIRSWLTDNPNVEILQVTQSESMVVMGPDKSRSCTITIFYDEIDKNSEKPPNPEQMEKHWNLAREPLKGSQT